MADLPVAELKVGAASAAPKRATLGVARPVPVLVVAGTTSTLEPELAERLLPIFQAVVAEVAARGGALVTGGTDAGIFHVLGLASESSANRIESRIGVAPDGLLVPSPAEIEPGTTQAPIDPQLSVLVRVEGANWGDETAMLSNVVAEVADTEPTAVLLVGGGDVTRAELVEHLRRGRTLIVVEGTGRLADELAAGSPPDADADLRALLNAGDVHRVPLRSGPARIRRAVKHALTRQRRSLGAALGHRWRTRRDRWVALSVFPRWPYRVAPPGPLVDHDAPIRFPLLAEQIAEADELIYPDFAECETQAGIEQNRYRWFTVLAIFGGLLTTAFGAVQAWLQSTQWPGVAVATLGAATTALSTIARRQGSRESYLRARLQTERLRSLYLQHLAVPTADEPADAGARRHDLTVKVARIRYGTDPT